MGMQSVDPGNMKKFFQFKIKFLADKKDQQEMSLLLLPSRCILQNLKEVRVNLLGMLKNG
jgi:hypothetical protein